ncbi:MAG: hypothetical protein EOO38_13535, partial [Cytophagaceae bacterium]
MNGILCAAGLRKMMSSITVAFGAMLCLAPLAVHAHIAMISPIPYSPIPDSSPLKTDGTNYPCKMPPTGLSIATMNMWPVGSTQKLMLNGSATHDGGSCQISVTSDKTPTKDSAWKVIYSIEGACPPPPPTGGNWLVDGQDPATPWLYQVPGWNGFDFTVPPELPNGEMAMSFSWINAMGNREFYQNCAPITVSGGSNDKTAFEALPNMHMINLDAFTTCKAPEGYKGYAFPNPGKYATRLVNVSIPTLTCTPDGGAGAGGDPAATPPPAGTGVSSQAPHLSRPPVNPGMSSQAPAASPSVNAGIPTPSQAAAPPAGDKATSTSRITVTVTAPTGPKPASANGTSIAAPPKSSPPLSLASAPKATPPAPAASVAAPSDIAPPTSGESCTSDGAIICSADGKKFGLGRP